MHRPAGAFTSLTSQGVCLALLLILRWRVGVLFRRWAERFSSHRVLQAAIFVPLLLALLAVVGLPAEIVRHRLALSYKLSVQGWPSWLLDWAKDRSARLHSHSSWCGSYSGNAAQPSPLVVLAWLACADPGFRRSSSARGWSTPFFRLHSARLFPTDMALSD